jgi:L-lactate dehydrogenase complex protein LldE
MKRVYFFSTCLIEHLYPDVGMDAVALLELCGYRCEVPSQQTCCGQPGYNSGATEASLAVAEHTLNVFSQEPLPIIVPSASCADMIKNHYPKLFRDGSPLHQQAIALASRCFEFIDFVVDKLPKPLPNDASRSAMLHISCSARRGTKTYESWQQALDKAFDAPTIEPIDAFECCGFGGTFSLKSPAISTVMAEDKCQGLMANGNDTFYSGDCGCLMHLNSYAEKQALPIKGKHIITTLAERLGVAHAK